VFAEALRACIAGIVDLSAVQVQALEQHYELLVRWNQKINLTAIRTLQEAVERHYAESLFLGAHLPPGLLQVADVGSGAGFPGIPVAVLRRDCVVTLVESHQRKAVFLREASRRLSNVRVIAKRAEEVEERFDRVISRAVSYGELLPALKKLAPNADLLTGAEDPPVEFGFEWATPIALPWGERRYLRSGYRIIHGNTGKKTA
jgi:16S rRNA (guanine527-N7)-methyltransferase